MHTPAAAVAWAEWAVWTCNTPQRVWVDQGLADQKSARPFHVGVGCTIRLNFIIGPRLFGYRIDTPDQASWRSSPGAGGRIHASPLRSTHRYAARDRRDSAR